MLAQDKMKDRIREEKEKRTREGNDHMLHRDKALKTWKERDAFSTAKSYGCNREVYLWLDRKDMESENIKRGIFMQMWGLKYRDEEANAYVISKFRNEFDNGLGNVHICCRITYEVHITNSSTQFGLKDGTAAYKGAHAKAQMVIPQALAQKIVDSDGTFRWGVKIKECMISCVFDSDREFGSGTQEQLGCIDVMDQKNRGWGNESVFRSVATRKKSDNLKARG